MGPVSGVERPWVPRSGWESSWTTKGEGGCDTESPLGRPWKVSGVVPGDCLALREKGRRAHVGLVDMGYWPLSGQDGAGSVGCRGEAFEGPWDYVAW